MSEGLTSIEDLKVVITAETEKMSQGLTNAGELLTRFATDSEGKLGRFDSAVGKSGAALLALRGALGVWATAATIALDVLQKIGEKGDVAFKKLGADEEWGKLKASVADLVPALQEGATGAFSTATMAALAYGVALSGVDLATDKAGASTKKLADEKLAAAREMMDRAGHEFRRLAPQEQWKVGTVDAELARARREIDAIVQRIESFTKNGTVSALDALLGTLVPGNQHLLSLETLQNRLAALQTQLESLGNLRVQKQWSVLDVDKDTAGLMQPIEREIEALKLRTATLSMGAAEAAAHVAGERVRAEAIKNGEKALAAANEELARRLPLMVALRQKIEDFKDAEDERKEDEREAARQEKGRDSVLQGLDREVMQMRQKQRALTDTSAAARALEIEERTLAQARQRNIEVTEEMIVQVRAYANEIAKGEDALKNHQKLLDQFNKSNEIVFRGLETTISRYMQGTQLNFKQIVSSMLQDLAMLTLKMTVLQPLQQGMSSGFSGLMGGGGIGDLFGGFRADGGPVDAGRAYIVGERGPEMFIPRETGAVVSNEQMRGAAQASRSSAPVTVQIHNHVDARGAYPESIADIKRAIAEQQQSLPGRVIEVVHDARERGGL